jgi:CHRD domain
MRSIVNVIRISFWRLHFLNLKIINMKRKIHSLAFLSLTAFASFVSGCGKDNNNTPTADMYNISASMSPSQEVGTLAGSPTGSGTTTGTYNATNNTLQYSATWSGLTGTATVGHFHGPALAGANAGVVIPFNLINNGNSGTASGTITLTDAQETDLLAGKWYSNIHTATNAGGEIRGQVSAVHQ